MNNLDGGAIFSNYSTSSASSSSPADANYSSSYLSLNMVNNNYEQQTDHKERRKHETASGDHFVADHGTSSTGKINIAGEKKIKKPKHAFQTRSQVDILDDGYRWRKYGQKAVKNNKYPRNYYRCTHQGCNVKKQVQRLSNDDGVVVTTYEGVHSHPIDKSTDNFENILTQMQIYSR